jgi:hypothetical protein
MKRLVLAILAVSVLALPVCAQRTVAVGDIPFGFVVGNVTMPAGEYAFGYSAGLFIVTLAGADRHTNFLSANPEVVQSVPEQAKLVFHRYGDQYFLSEIRTPAGSREFPMSRVEVEAQKTASAGRASEKIVLAMR